MQEEVENRTLTLVVSGTKFTGRLLKAAISKYLAHRKEIGIDVYDLRFVIVDPMVLACAEKSVLSFKIGMPVEVHVALPPHFPAR